MTAARAPLHHRPHPSASKIQRRSFFPAFPVVDANESLLSIPYSFEALTTKETLSPMKWLKIIPRITNAFLQGLLGFRRFLSVQPIPDYESPDDLNADNVYELIIRVSDGIGQMRCIQIRC